MSCCPPETVECFFVCLAVTYAKKKVKKGGTGVPTPSPQKDPREDQALALLDQLADEANEGSVDFERFTATAYKLRDLNELDAADALSHSLTSGITMGITYHTFPVGQVRSILQQNYQLQSEIFLAQGGSPEDDVARQALEVLSSQSAS